MWWCFSLVFVLVTVDCAKGHSVYGKDKKFEIVANIIKDCINSRDRYSCFADKAAVAVERAMNWDIPIIGGIQLKRNEYPINATQGRSLSGFTRFSSAVANFITSHKLSLSLNDARSEFESRASRDEDYEYDVIEEQEEEPRPLGGGMMEDSSEKIISLGGGGGGGKKGTRRRFRKPGGGGGGGGMSGLGSLGINKKAIKKEAKYMKYAFMVLLGIFGLTGPLVMKTLALIAGNALLASKAALLIVGGVALKKIFEHNDHHEKSTVKVHTIPSYDHDDHDRTGYNYITSYNPYSSYSHYARNSQQGNGT